MSICSGKKIVEVCPLRCDWGIEAGPSWGCFDSVISGRSSENSFLKAVGKIWKFATSLGMSGCDKLENSKLSKSTPRSFELKWGLCALRHGIQISMEAILPCHPARSTEWLDCHPKWCELWRIRTGPICNKSLGIIDRLLQEELLLRRTLSREESVNGTKERLHQDIIQVPAGIVTWSEEVCCEGRKCYAGRKRYPSLSVGYVTRGLLFSGRKSFAAGRKRFPLTAAPLAFLRRTR